MTFIEMRDKLYAHFKQMCDEADFLYEVDLDKDALWNTYLDSYPAGTNEIFRERRSHDCSACRHFIKQLGNVVAIKDLQLVTIWDFKTNDEVYQPVLDAMSAFVKKHSIGNVFVTDQKRIGCDENYEYGERGEVTTWNHFYADVPEEFISRDTHMSLSEIKARHRDTSHVLLRSLEELTLDAVDTVLELIYSNTLYRGEEWKISLETFRLLKHEYDSVPDDKKMLFAWSQAPIQQMSVARIRNHSIGTLLIDISEGCDLNEAVRKYEVIVAPANYKRPKEIFTQKMLDDAKETITRLGYLDALGRRYAKLDDITVNNILFSNKDSAKRIEGADDIFGEMSKDAKRKPLKFDHVDEIGIDDFIQNVLPTVSEMELYLTNSHSGNLVSLIAPKVADSKTMFKWDNNFSWAYAGNLTDSMKERVKAAGGKVDGDLRFSIQWNELDFDDNDLDAHCMEPDGYEIYFGNARVKSPQKGELDVDIIHPRQGEPAVENIVYMDKTRMKPGVYTLFVNCYSRRGGTSGFRAEVEFNGSIYAFDYNAPLRAGENVVVAEIIVDSNHNLSINEKIPSSASSKTVWNLPTNNFIPVTVMMYSPNYWNEQQGIGNKHYFFMLKDCVNSESPNGFYNEFLKNELVEHKRVFAALGSKMRVENSEDQLSGVGFSSTKRAEAVVKIKGSTERVLKIKF